MKSEILSAVASALAVANTVATALADSGMGGPVATIFAAGVKIAAGVAAAAPEAITLYERIQSGDIPTQAELDAYAATENEAYRKLMAAIDAELAATK
jgi:hypothetical protein